MTSFKATSLLATWCFRNIKPRTQKLHHITVASLMCMIISVNNASAMFLQQSEDFVDDLDGEFTELDEKLESSFLQSDAQLEAQYNAVHKAIQAAYNNETKKIEVHWPNSVVVPNGAVWVAYSTDYTERVIYNFEQGFYQIEAAKNGNATSNLARLAELAKNVSRDKATVLQSMDVFSRSIQQEVAKVAPVDRVQNTPALVKIKNLDGEANNVEEKQFSQTTMPNTGPTRRGLFKSQNYHILASISAPTPSLDVEKLIERLSQEQGLKLNRHATAKTHIPAPSVSSEEGLPSSIAMSSKAVSKTSNRGASNMPVPENIELMETSRAWSLKIPFVNNFQQTLIDQRMLTITTMSQRYNVDVSTILAIIEAESSFNPMATSHIPAFGLMQLVPRTAGVDAYRHVYGQHKILSPEYLYDIENNLELGTAYIDLLQTRYLRGITDSDNKLYSMIASYNTGVGNLASTINGKKGIRAAVPVINKMPANQYYQFLQAQLPAEETKRYLDKVIAKRNKYLHLDLQ